MIKQKTVNNIISFNGIGIHSGKISNITIKPNDVNTGIIFVKNNKAVKAKYDFVIGTFFGTNIGLNNFMQKFLTNFFLKFGIVKTYGTVIRTIEHLMSALWACDIDNAIIEIDNEETPIMDGSANLFIKEIKKAGIKEQNENRKYLIIKRPVEVYGNNKFLKIFPYDSFKIDMEVEFTYGGIGKQNYTFNGGKEEFINDIATSRTFGYIKDYEKAKKHNLCKGGSLDNAIAFDDNTFLNPDGLRYDNEVCRHKILDCVGDMYSSGYNIKGYIKGKRTGHTLDNKLLKKIFSDKNNYEIA